MKTCLNVIKLTNGMYVNEYKQIMDFVMEYV